LLDYSQIALPLSYAECTTGWIKLQRKNKIKEKKENVPEKMKENEGR
jgi:hypothetical protein